MSMVEMMASYFLASSPGMMPSQSCFTMVHLTCICSHRALAISTSNPLTSPLGSVQEKGGRITSYNVCYTKLLRTVLGLLQLGEFEYADQLQACLSESALADPMVSQCLNSARHDSLLAERNQKYQELNEQGILAYKNGHLDEALRNNFV